MIGKLRQRITIQKNTPTRTQGVKTDVWANIETIYAEVRPLRGVEAPTASQKEMIATHEVVTRYRPTLSDAFLFLDETPFQFLDATPFEFIASGFGLLGRYRIQFGTRYFDIRSILYKNPRKRYTTMRVEEVIT